MKQLASDPLAEHRPEVTHWRSTVRIGQEEIGMLKERRKARIAKLEQEETDRMAKLKSKDTQKLIEEDARFEKLRLKHELELEVGKKKEKRRLKLKMEKTRNSELLLLHGDKPKLLCFLGKSDQMDGYFFRFEKKTKTKTHTHRVANDMQICGTLILLHS